jgi:nitrate/nitrite-specific signal transduction histidine kinase
MKTTKISTKIKLIGASLMFLILSVIGITIYLNENNAKDALIVNIAGKERMLTQRIAKNIFYLYHNHNFDFSELNHSVDEFIYNINSLKNGNKLINIESAPTDKIAEQISKVLILWQGFYKNVELFKYLLIQRSTNEEYLKVRVDYIYNTNNVLLKEVDKLVTMYTIHTESKTNFIEKFQYGGAFVLFLLIMYSLMQLKVIEAHVKEFMDYSKKLTQTNSKDKIELINIEAESEIIEVSDNMNCFINKINDAMDYSNDAIEQSKRASTALEDITDEFGLILHEIANSSEIAKELNISEDIVIESTEELINSTKKLQHLKEKLDKLLIQCKV